MDQAEVFDLWHATRLVLTVATDCIEMGYIVCIFRFPYLQLPREKRCTQVLGNTGASFVYFAKGGGKIMHIDQTFLLFVDEGKAQLECWAVA